MKRPVPPTSGWVSYVAYKLRPDYKVMGEANRFQLAAFLVEILESPHDRVDVDCYCSIGFRADCDFFVRYQAPTAEELQDICVKVNSSGLGRFLETVHNWLAVYREWKHAEVEEPDPDEEVPETRFFVVHPLQRERDWFFLEGEERCKMMREHAALRKKYPTIHPHVARSFGVGDQEWVLGFEVSDLDEFEKMYQELRSAPDARFSRSETPVLVGTRCTANEVLELCGAL